MKEFRMRNPLDVSLNTQAYEDFPPNVALSKELANRRDLPAYETFGANEIAERDDLSSIEGALAFERGSTKDERYRALHGERQGVLELQSQGIGIEFDPKKEQEYQNLKKEDREQKTEPKTYFTAQGGRIGYQEGNMVGGEMGGEMQSAMMQSKEVIKDLFDALTAQGLSPQEAMEEIKRMLSGIRPEEGAEAMPRSPDQGPPQAPMPELGGGPRPMPMRPGPGGRPPFTREPLTPGPMRGEEFPGQEFRGRPRAPAAFGGIMDTYTGRRKYGLGSFIKKAFKKVKKLASSKLGKIALMYVAGTYLGGTAAFGGTGWGSGVGATPWKKFGAQLLNPMGKQGIGNLARPGGWGMFQGAPADAAVASQSWRTSNVMNPENLKNLQNVKKAGDWSKWILPASIGAGAYTAAAPVEGLDDSTSEWERKKTDFDDYLASLEGSYRLPEDLRLTSAQGGRIGRQEGGLMDLGGMEKDYRDDGGFVPLGGEEKADDVPARLSKNEFVFTADAVRNAGGGDIDRGAEVMENVMKNLEAGGQVSEESQGQGAEEMFEVSERLSEVV